MDRAGIEELISFTEYAWDTYEETIRPLGDEVLTRPAPGSGWPALRDALVHMTWAYVRWLASPVATTDEPKEPVNSWKDLDVYRRRVRDSMRVYLDSLDDAVLLAPREMSVDGEPMLYSPADIFVHLMLHERQHHGYLNTLLPQRGAEIPIVECRFCLPDPPA